MYHLFFLSLIYLHGTHALCPDTVNCISKIRDLASGPRRFWFGEHRKAVCHHRHSNPVDCYNPAHLSPYHSIGSRLFRAKTYHTAYLRNLKIFPRITYRASPGEYRACDHNFHVRNNATVIEADPDMDPVAPFLIRKKPEIGWKGLEFDEEFILLMTDVGFGTLNYLVTEFPKKPKVWKEYEPSDNFRALPNPMVLLVFERSRGNGDMDLILPKTEDFNLGDFMIQNELTDNLVGMSVIIVGSDPFAIERQRLKGVVDNCHSLIKKKIQRDSPSKLLARLPLEETNTWLSTAFEQQELHASVCCERVDMSRGVVVVDPLGDPTVSSLIALDPPRVSALRVPPTTANSNYHRSARTFVALMDELFSLVLIDGHTGKLHWMVVDIPAGELASDVRGHGVTKAAYLPPIPSDPAQCWPFIFILLSQKSSMPAMHKFCADDCIERRLFKFEEFKQRYNLRLAAISWMSSCYDLPYAYHSLSSRVASENTTQSYGIPSRRSTLSKGVRSESQRLCSAFNVSPHHKCSVAAYLSAAAYVPYSTLGVYLIGYILLTRVI